MALHLMKSCLKLSPNPPSPLLQFQIHFNIKNTTSFSANRSSLYHYTTINDKIHPVYCSNNDSGRELVSLSDEKLLSQCEMDTYKASGPGGQHRNKRESAVRLKHLPTGIIAQVSYNVLFWSWLFRRCLIVCVCWLWLWLFRKVIVII